MIVILVPTFNCIDRIGITLDSLLDKHALNVIISDNFSTDGTWEYIKLRCSGMDNFEISQNISNIGRVGNWNKCLILAERRTAKMIMFLMAGDSLKSDFESNIPTSKHSAKKLLVYAPIELLTARGRIISRRSRYVDRFIDGQTMLYHLLKYGIPFLGPLQANLLFSSSGRFPKFRDEVDGYYADQHFIVDFIADGCEVAITLNPFSSFNQMFNRTHNSLFVVERLLGDFSFISNVYHRVFGMEPPLWVKVRWGFINISRYLLGYFRRYV